jgi:hypothetical protein
MSSRWLRLLEVGITVLIAALGVYIRARAYGDNTWCFGGSDSFGYARLGTELLSHGRYALGPPPEPLVWVRPPLYPIFLGLVFRSADLYHASWIGLFVAQIGLDVVTGVLAQLMARRLAGPVAGLIAIALTQVNPITPLFALAMLTETLATTLATATVATIVLGSDRPRRWWPLAGALMALSTLLRPDGLLLGAAFATALVTLPGSWRAKMRWSAAALIGFVVVFAPWPIRNQLRFGNPHPVGGHLDRQTHAVQYYDGYYSWLRSWARDSAPMTTPTTCFYETHCPGVLRDLAARFGAYTDFDDQAAVNALVEKRFATGLTAEVDAGFRKLAAARRRAHPFTVEIVLPLSRAWYMWDGPFNEILQARPPWIWRQLWPYIPYYARVQCFAILAAGLFLSWRRRTRALASILFVTLLARTLVMAYSFYCMQRYAIEVMPLGWVLVAVAPVEAASLLWRRFFPSAP